jgi:hypothetical protein
MFISSPPPPQSRAVCPLGRLPKNLYNSNGVFMVSAIYFVCCTDNTSFAKIKILFWGWLYEGRIALSEPPPQASHLRNRVVGKTHREADSSPVAFKYKSGRAARSGRVEAHGKGERRKFLPFSPCARPPLVLIYIYI